MDSTPRRDPLEIIILIPILLILLVLVLFLILLFLLVALFFAAPQSRRLWQAAYVFFASNGFVKTSSTSPYSLASIALNLLAAETNSMTLKSCSLSDSCRRQWRNPNTMNR